MANHASNARLVMLGHVESELESLSVSVEHNPSDPIALYRLAEGYRTLGNVSSWSLCVERALELDHITHEQICYRAQAKLLLGEWSGWTDFESRLFHPSWGHVGSERGRLRQWRRRALRPNDNLHEQRVLLLRQGGLGDTIQMLRFIPMMARQAKKLIVAIPPELFVFVRHNMRHVADISFDMLADDIQYDLYAYLLSLPAYCGGLPRFEPLVAPRPMPRCAYRSLRIGLAWAGSPSTANDEYRSIRFDTMASILGEVEAEYVNLQVGPRAVDADGYHEVIKPDPPLVSFADTANLMMSLDCVITVDTAVCHLAGVLGVPTFLLLPTCSCWRWGLGPTTPWYPTVQIIRQSSFGDWSGALELLQQQLRILVGVRREVSI